MSQPGDRAAEGPDRGRTTPGRVGPPGTGRPTTGPGRPPAGSGTPADDAAVRAQAPDAVRRADLWRARLSALGRSATQDAARFATEIARAVAEDAARPAHPEMSPAAAASAPSSPGASVAGAPSAGAPPALSPGASRAVPAGASRTASAGASRTASPGASRVMYTGASRTVSPASLPPGSSAVSPPMSPTASPPLPPMGSPAGSAAAAGWLSGAAVPVRPRDVVADQPTDPYPMDPLPDLDIPTLRDTVFGDAGLLREPDEAESLTLPQAPAAVCDRSGRIVRVNAALQRLVGEDVELFGRRLHQVVAGPEDDARLTRCDGTPTRVRVVRWEPLGGQLSVVVLVELCAGREAEPDRAWTVELERLARVGTWSYELGAGRLQRSETLEELYRTVGLDPNGAGAPETRQIEELVGAIRSGGVPPGRHVELRMPGDVVLSCRAEVEYAWDGSPARLVGVVRDLSAQRPAGRRFLDLMALLPDGVAVLDAAGRVVAANTSLATLLDVPIERLRGISGAALAAPQPGEWPDGDAWPSWLRPVPPGAQYGYRVEGAPLRRGDGTSVWCDLAVATTLADDGSRVWIVTATDATDRRRVAEVLRNAGTVDELTRLPNRAAGLELVDQLLAGPCRDRVAVVCGDLDDFQRVNSSLGHEAGDDLLVSLAGRLQRELPVGCTAARLSGDEFVVICADHAEVGGPDQLARLVADLLRTTVTVHGRPVPLTASVGLATPVPSGDVRAADLLRFAEVAMHDVKRRQCRGGIAVATDGVVSSATRALELEAELRATIAVDGLALAYQPVVGPDGHVLSLEALVRWPHPERGTIPPADFLPVAQRSGLLRDLDLWVLRTATAAAATWPAHQGVLPAVAVNLAGLLPGDAGFEQAVTDAVTAAGLDPDRLVLELVETSLVALPAQALAAMQRLTERGVRFAVDDFGTGYSSLARLKELPAQTVKIDRAFVRGVADDPVDFAVARAVVDMAGAMGRTTVAEGVETPEQFHVLRGIGVDAYQGWLFSRPLDPDAVPGVLTGGRLGTPAAARTS